MAKATPETWSTGFLAVWFMVLGIWVASDVDGWEDWVGSGLLVGVSIGLSWSLWKGLRHGPR